jgi:iron complex transport system substrate-binding protein
MIKLWIVNFILIFSLLSFASTAVAGPPERIISLAPNLTEILFAMGLEDRIVGVTGFCDYPEAAKKKQKVGGMSDPSLEAVVSLKPDIVVMTTDGNFRDFEERLRSLRIKTYVFKARRLSELPQGIRELGAALGEKEKAGVLAAKIEAGVKKLQGMKTSQHKKVLFIVWPEPLIVAGPGTAVDDAIKMLGPVNIASKAKVSYPKYSIEEIIRQSPDIILIGKGHAEIKELSQGLLKKLSGTPAVRNNRVFFLSDNLYRLGPRIIKGIEELSACLQ